MSSAKILKALYQHICRQFRANGGSSSRTDLRIRSPNNTDRARLIWISSVLDMLIFDHLPESAREMKLGEAQKLLESMPLLKLQGRIEKKLVLAEQLIE